MNGSGFDQARGGCDPRGRLRRTAGGQRPGEWAAAAAGRMTGRRRRRGETGGLLAWAVGLRLLEMRDLEIGPEYMGFPSFEVCTSRINCSKKTSQINYGHFILVHFTYFVCLTIFFSLFYKEKCNEFSLLVL